jgi:hypothetical protein
MHSAKRTEARREGVVPCVSRPSSLAWRAQLVPPGSPPARRLDRPATRFLNRSRAEQSRAGALANQTIEGMCDLEKQWPLALALG